MHRRLRRIIGGLPSAAWACATIALNASGSRDREIGQHLAVELDAGALQAVHELRVGEAVLAHAGIDALDPQARGTSRFLLRRSR